MQFRRYLNQISPFQMFYFTASQVLPSVTGVHQEVLSSLPWTEESFIVLLLQKNYAQGALHT